MIKRKLGNRNFIFVLLSLTQKAQSLYLDKGDAGSFCLLNFVTLCLVVPRFLAKREENMAAFLLHTFGMIPDKTFANK